MKNMSLDHSPGAVRDLRAATKQGYILLTRGGKPVAYVLPTRFYDEEDIGYMTDPAFWKMIRQRREQGGPSIPLERVEAELAEREAAERATRRPAKSRNGKQGKRNGTARS
jgi:hypothetical protein